MKDKITVLVPVEFSRERVIVNKGAIYNAPIIPESPKQINRSLDVFDNVVLGSDAFGKNVMVGKNCQINGTVFGENTIKIDAKTVIAKHVLSNGLVTLDNGCIVNGNIIASQISIERDCKIKGSIIAEKSVKLGTNSKVAGVVICTDGDIILSDRCSAYDVICNGTMTLDGNISISDTVLLAQKIQGGNQLQLCGKNSQNNHIITQTGYMEYNLNADRMSERLATTFPISENIKEMVDGLLVGLEEKESPENNEQHKDIWLCNYCNKEFATEKDALAHEKTCELKDDDEDIWLCKYCNKEFATEKDALAHEKTCELKDDDEDIWLCEYCNKEFATEKDALAHEKTCKKRKSSIKRTVYKCVNPYS